MSDAPKLYTNKPKKAQLKQVQEQVKGKDFSLPSSSSAAAAAASYTMGPPPTPHPPPPPQKQSFAKRYKFLWPLLLAVNFSVGAYLFMRTRKKDTDVTVEDTAKDVMSTPVSTTAVTIAPVAEKPLPVVPIAAPVKLPEPIPESQQRELFKWMLEEKRKVKPTDPESKKLLDEEKALLKQLIRAKSIPSI